MDDVRTGVAHFRVAGIDLTCIARDFMLSDLPAKAWRLLGLGLRGDGVTDAAMKILDGKARLTGDEKGMGLEDELPNVREAYQRDLHFIYAGRVKLQKSWYRPKAFVRVFGPEDMRRSHAIREGERSVIQGDGGYNMIQKISRARVAAYAVEGERVVRCDRHFAKWVIFEPCGEAPFWWDEPTTPDEALKKFLAVGKRLDEYVHDETFPEAEPMTFGSVRTAPTKEEADEVLRKAREDDDLRERAYKATLAVYRTKILAQAGDDLFEMTYKKHTLKVPRAPFEHWALGRTALKPFAPPWEPVCPSGMKLQLDDPYHTDWMVGAGLDLYKDYHDDKLRKASYNASWEVQQKYSEWKCQVLVAGIGRSHYGAIVHPKPGEPCEAGQVVVLPSLDPKYLEATLKAGAIITEQGGALAHLATVSLERGTPVVRVEGALKTYLPKMRVTVNTAEGTITISTTQEL